MPSPRKKASAPWAMCKGCKADAPKLNPRETVAQWCGRTRWDFLDNQSDKLCCPTCLGDVQTRDRVRDPDGYAIRNDPERGWVEIDNWKYKIEGAPSGTFPAAPRMPVALEALTINGLGLTGESDKEDARAIDVNDSIHVTWKTAQGPLRVTLRRVK